MSGTVILNIVIVLGIIIAGGFVVFFLGDLLLAILNPKKDEKVIKEKKQRESDRLQKKINELSPENAEKVKKNPEVAEVLYGGVVVEDYNPNEGEETTEDKQEEVEEKEEAQETPAPSDEEARNAYIEERRRELMERLARMNEESEDEDEEDEEEEEEVEDEEEEAVEEEVVDADEEEEDDEEEKVSAEELEQARKELAEVRAKNETLLSELNSARAEMAKQQNVTVTEEVYLSEEDYEARLAVLEENLKLNEKELRACKKEYVPLRKIKTALERDEKKLRRSPCCKTKTCTLWSKQL